MQHKFDSTNRFSHRVENYIRYRPGYPVLILPFLTGAGILEAGMKIADIGSGTGISSELFLKNGNAVYGVEPNKEMREAAERLLKSYKNFFSVNGTAERTTLPAAAVDMIVAGQAFHWFDVAKASVEMKRILKPGGYAVLIWNDRKTDAGPFLTDYDALLHKYCIDYSEVNHKNIDAKVMDAFFGKANWKEEIFPNAQLFDLEGLKGRILSSSYAPPEEHPNFVPMMHAMKELFDRYNNKGKVSLDYDTRVFYGKIS
jgi:SAM-dependent methyltransferase